MPAAISPRRAPSATSPRGDRRADAHLVRNKKRKTARTFNCPGCFAFHTEPRRDGSGHGFLLTVRYFDVCPTADVTLTVKIISNCHHSAVGLQTHGVEPTGSRTDNIAPILNCICSKAAVTVCNDCSARCDPYNSAAASRDGADVFPIMYAVSADNGNDCSIGFKTDQIRDPAGKRTYI